MYARLYASLLTISLCITPNTYSDDHNGASSRYKNELNCYIKNPTNKEMFSKDTAVALAHIQRDINNYQHSTFLQRCINFVIFSQDVIVVTPDTMPQLYAYVEDLCATHRVIMPMVCISRKKGILNACATEFASYFGCILIEQRLIMESSDEVLEAVIAHEIGHIKYGHVSKISTLDTITSIGILLFDNTVLHRKLNISSYDALMRHLWIRKLITSFIINKRFEKQADEFAYKECGKGNGLIEFFEYIEHKEDVYEQGFNHTYDLIQAHHKELGSIDYAKLMGRYYIARFFDSLLSGYRWLYHNTFLGAHPSPAARIAAIRHYQETIS